MDSIVVGIDGSKGATVATRWAATQAHERGAHVDRGLCDTAHRALVDVRRADQRRQGAR